MIHSSLDFLRRQLDEYLHGVESLNLTPNSDIVVLGDIARIESAESSGMDNEGVASRIVITLVRIEEETTLSNQRHYTTTNDSVQYHNKPLHLNLYLLVSANFSTYPTALLYLDQIIQYFVSNRVYTRSSHPSLPPGSQQLFIDLYDPGFEQLSYIWSPLGGKAFPSVIYKLRLVAYQDVPDRISSPIDAVGLNENAF